MRFTLCLAGTTMLGSSVIAAPAIAGEVAVRVEIPQLSVAEYHRPYVAAWIEDSKGDVVANLANWYDLKNRREDGAKWLPELRTWWRRSGRALDLPVDGSSGPTRAPGKYVLRFSEGTKSLPRLAGGKYVLRVEAAREVGGREILSIPFTWPPAKTLTGTVHGKSELGEVTLQIKP